MALKSDPESADLTVRERTMLAFARKLTKSPAEMRKSDVEKLREAEPHDFAKEESRLSGASCSSERL